MQVTAIVLAGGAAQRLGGAAKPYLSVGGQPLLHRVLASCRSAGVRDIVVVGSEPPSSLQQDLDSGLLWTREEPPGGGPARAVGAGLRVLPPTERLVLLLAGDAPRVASALPPILLAARASAAAGGAGAWAVSDGVRQPLLACVRAGELRALDLDAGGSLFTALAGLGLAEVAVDQASVADADTWDDLIALRREADMAGETDAGQERLRQWVATAADSAGVPPDVVDIDAILDLAREAAHHVERPAAPLTTYLLGYAAAAQHLDATATAALADQLAALARAQAPE